MALFVTAGRRVIVFFVVHLVGIGRTLHLLSRLQVFVTFKAPHAGVKGTTPHSCSSIVRSTSSSSLWRMARLYLAHAQQATSIPALLVQAGPTAGRAVSSNACNSANILPSHNRATNISSCKTIGAGAGDAGHGPAPARAHSLPRSAHSLPAQHGRAARVVGHAALQQNDCCEHIPPLQLQQAPGLRRGVQTWSAPSLADHVARFEAACTLGMQTVFSHPAGRLLGGCERCMHAAGHTWQRLALLGLMVRPCCSTVRHLPAHSRTQG